MSDIIPAEELDVLRQQTRYLRGDRTIRRLLAHIAAQEAVIAKMREALQNVKEWEAGLVPEDGIRYGAYYPAFAVNAALALPNGHGGPLAGGTEGGTP